jgi:hypothetical protein
MGQLNLVDEQGKSLPTPQAQTPALNLVDEAGKPLAGTTPAKPAPIQEPSLVGGFWNEVKRNTGNLLDAMNHPTQYVDPKTGETKDPVIPNPGLLPGAIANPAAGEWQGLRNILPMLKESPLAHLAGAVSDLTKQGLRAAGVMNPELSAAQQIEQKIAPAGDRARRLAMDTAKVLADDPEMVQAKPGLHFDRMLFWRYRQAGNALRTVEAQIPDQTPVDTRFIQTGMDDLIDRYKSVAADDAVKALSAQKERLTRFGDEMPWDQFNGFKQRLGNDLEKSGVWKRLMNGTATEKAQALAQAYGHFMETTSGISDELAKANGKFATYADAVDAAGLDRQTGRRVADVGAPLPPSVLQKAGKLALKAGLTAGAGTAGAAAAYDLYKTLKPGN